jgi:tetratricopeptide (TPR) repeat protein
MSDRLRVHWTFDDLDATERRLRSALAEEQSNEGRAEVLTQLARVEGLRGDFEAGERYIEEAEALAGDHGVASVRIDLERGRIRRSSGDPDAPRPLFEAAYARACGQGSWYLAADAAHMVALAAPDRAGFVEWTGKGIDVAEAHEDAAYWSGPLLNNLGWEHYESGEFDDALAAFERALRARERNPADGDGISLARYAVGKTLRALGRAEDGIPLLEEAVAWAEAEGKPDGWFHEELAEEYAAVGRDADARTHAQRALPLLGEADPSFAENAARSARLQTLATMNAPPHG